MLKDAETIRSIFVQSYSSFLYCGLGLAKAQKGLDLLIVRNGMGT